MEEGRTAVKEIGGKVVKNVYRLRLAFYYQHRRTNEDFLMTTVGVVVTTRSRERVNYAKTSRTVLAVLFCTVLYHLNIC